MIEAVCDPDPFWRVIKPRLFGLPAHSETNIRTEKFGKSTKMWSSFASSPSIADGSVYGKCTLLKWHVELRDFITALLVSPSLRG